MDKMREDFEKFISERNKAVTSAGAGAKYIVTNAHYVIWVEAWQASRKALVVELPQPNNDGEDSLMRRVEIALDKAGVGY